MADLAPVFSPDDEVGELWVRAYQGEVLGEALFGRLADRFGDDRAEKLRVLATLERRTKEAIAPALERAGLSTEPDPAMLSLADALAAGDLEWDGFLAATQAVTVQYIPLYVRIGELDPSEQATSELLVAHEAALRSFARAELAGDTANSLDAVNDLDHMR